MQFFNLLSSVYLIDAVEPVAKWVTITLTALLFAGWLSLWITSKFVKSPVIGKIAKTMLIGYIFYALVLGICLLILEIGKKYNLNYLNDKWVSDKVLTMVLYPLLITAVLALIGIITIFATAKKSAKAFKISKIITTIVLSVCTIISLILIAVYYSQEIVGAGYYVEYGKLNSAVLYLSAGLLVVALTSLSFIIGRKNKTELNTRCIAMAGICVALSFALSFIKFESAWLQGGSITLFSFLPICLFAYTYGMKKGLFVGLLYGLLQAIQDPFILHPAQFLLDYPLAFSSIALSGLLTDLNVLNGKPIFKFSLSVIFTGITRYVCHTLSGVFAFGAYALDNGQTNILLYSAVYNTYVFIDIALVLVAGIILFSSKSFKKELAKMQPNNNI